MPFYIRYGWTGDDQMVYSFVGDGMLDLECPEKVHELLNIPLNVSCGSI
jgi:hypothetical protein